jgi:endonuclease/exonuclease/phosphatase family metal-dependent hydrolase
MLRFLSKIPGFFIRTAAFIGMTGLGLAALAWLVSPADLLLPAFFGLSFPFWLVITFLGLFYSVIRKRWWLTGVSLVVLILTYPMTRATFGMGLSSTNEQSEDMPANGELTVLSYNVRLFDLYNWTAGSSTRDSIFEFLDKTPVDVLCFQEFYHTDRKGVFDTRDTLITFLQNTYYHEKYTHEMNGKQYFGVATFSRYPIIKKGEIAFASDVNNYCIYSDLKVGEDTIRVYNAHLASIRFQKEDYSAIDKGPDSDEAKRLATRIGRAFVQRASQVDEIANNIAECPYPVVVCGDFNDTPISYAYRRMSEQVHDAFVGNYFGFGGTHIGLLPFLRIDYVMRSEGLQVKKFELHSEVELSDHHPIEVHLSW